MLSAIVNASKPFVHHVKKIIKNFTKPTTAVLAAGAASDITRSRKDLIAENVILRQQFIVLNRQVKRPKFTNGDRLRLVFLSRLTQFWNSALHLIQPQTLLRWHRDLFRLYWKRKSRLESRRIVHTAVPLTGMAIHEWSSLGLGVCFLTPCSIGAGCMKAPTAFSASSGPRSSTSAPGF